MSLTLCYAAPEYDGTVLATTDFGKTWKHAADRGLSPNAASCADGVTCVLGGGQTVVKTSDGGHSWAKTAITSFPWKYTGGGETTDLWNLACPIPGHCVATESSYDGKNSFDVIVVS